jgi:hypothetical protein
MFIADPSRKPTDIFLYTLQPTLPAKSQDEARAVMFRAKLYPCQLMLIASQE